VIKASHALLGTLPWLSRAFAGGSDESSHAKGEMVPAESNVKMAKTCLAIIRDIAEPRSRIVEGSSRAA